MLWFKLKPSKNIFWFITILHILPLTVYYQYLVINLAVLLSFIFYLLKLVLLKSAICQIRADDNNWQIKKNKQWHQVSVENYLLFGFLFLSLKSHQKSFYALVAKDSLDADSWRQLIIATKIHQKGKASFF